MSALLSFILGKLQEGQIRQQKLEDENRQVMRKTAENAATTNDLDTLSSLLPELTKSGIDPRPYTSLVKSQQKPELIAQLLNQSSPSISGEVAKTNPNIAIDPGNAAQPQAPPIVQQMKGVISQDLVERGMTKQLLGIDPGESWSRDRAFYADMNQARKANPQTGIDEIIEMSRQKFGYIPESVSKAVNVPIAYRQNIARSQIAQLWNDPQIDKGIALLTQSNPNISQKTAKMGFILNELIKSGVPLPEEFRPLHESYLGLSDELQALVNKQAASKTTAETLAKGRAEEQIAAETFSPKLEREAIKESELTKVKKAAEFEMEAAKPISAEDRAKQGIGSEIPTYTELANQGKRFASDTDRKFYEQTSAFLAQIKELRKMALDPKNGIFTGIGKDMASRKIGQAKLLKDRAEGNQKGRNFEKYSANLPVLARAFLQIAGESGGRFTDQDVESMGKLAAQTGSVFGFTDSEQLTKEKFDDLEKRLTAPLQKLLETTTIAPIGQPEMGWTLNEKGEPVQVRIK